MPSTTDSPSLTATRREQLPEWHADELSLVKVIPNEFTMLYPGKKYLAQVVPSSCDAPMLRALADACVEAAAYLEANES